MISSNIKEECSASDIDRWSQHWPPDSFSCLNAGLQFVQASWSRSSVIFFLSRYSNNNDGVLGVVCCDVVLCELLQKSFKIFILHAKLKSCNLGLTSRAKSSRVKSSRLPRRHLRAKYNHFPLNQIELNHNNSNNNDGGAKKKKKVKLSQVSSIKFTPATILANVLGKI